MPLKQDACLMFPWLSSLLLLVMSLASLLSIAFSCYSSLIALLVLGVVGVVLDEVAVDLLLFFTAVGPLPSLLL